MELLEAYRAYLKGAVIEEKAIDPDAQDVWKDIEFTSRYLDRVVNSNFYKYRIKKEGL